MQLRVKMASNAFSGRQEEVSRQYFITLSKECFQVFALLNKRIILTLINLNNVLTLRVYSARAHKIK